MKIKGMTEKYILREAVKPYVTDTIYKRQKHPFIAPPVSRFSNTALNEYIQEYFSTFEDERQGPDHRREMHKYLN